MASLLPTTSRYEWYRRKGIVDLPYPRIDARRRGALTKSMRALDLADVTPMIAKPFSPGQRVSGRGSGARAPVIRQGVDRLVHQRQLRRSAAGCAGAACGAQAGRDTSRA